MARCDSTEWVFHLPWVLLGLRTMPHKGCDTSAAEAVYGQPLVVPGEFLPPAPLDPHVELQPRDLFLHPRGVYLHMEQSIPEHLYSTRAPRIYPCVCALGPCTPITVPTIPRSIQVIQHVYRATMIEVNGKRDWMSWDRLKPAYTTPMNFDVYTRYGRQSRQPSRLGMKMQNTCILDGE